MTNDTSESLELFLDKLIDLPLKDERNLMDFPFFGLTTKPDFNIRTYDDGTYRLEVHPSTKGLANIWDRDIIIYGLSIIREKIDAGEEPNPIVSFSLYDFFRATGRKTVGGKDYEDFYDALHRLDGTRFRTNVSSNLTESKRGFGLINSFEMIERRLRSGRTVAAGAKLEFSSWLFRGAITPTRILTINPLYYSLRKGIERRLYQIARKSCGTQNEKWEYYLPTLQQKCGSHDILKSFARQIRTCVERQSIPDYDFTILDPEGCARKNKLEKTKVRITPKESRIVRPKASPMPAPQPQPPEEEQSSFLSVLDPPKSAMAPLQLRPETYERARRVAPGYDIYALEKEWRGWCARKGGRIEDPDAAFYGFCRAHARRHPIG